MKLSQLVNYRNELNQLSTLLAKKTSNDELSKILHLISTQDLQLEDYIRQLNAKYQNINQLFLEFDQELDKLKLSLNELITNTEKPRFIESYKIYEEYLGDETLNDVKNRKPVIATETELFYHTRINRYQSWSHPAMIIRPGIESYITSMVSCDPLYLVDVKYELLKPAMEQFNNVYQNRLRTYVVTEKENSEILYQLPNEQFGFVLVYNFFNFRPFEIIKQYLTELYQKIRPGGIIAFTINDCDRDKAVKLCEAGYCCYTPGYLIKELAHRVGFETEFVWSDLGPSTWMEFKKPGTYSSLRGGQTLAKVLPKPIV